MHCFSMQGIYLPKPTPVQCLARFRSSVPVSVIMVTPSIYVLLLEDLSTTFYCLHWPLAPAADARRRSWCRPAPALLC